MCKGSSGWGWAQSWCSVQGEPGVEVETCNEIKEEKFRIVVKICINWDQDQISEGFSIWLEWIALETTVGLGSGRNGFEIRVW